MAGLLLVVFGIALLLLELKVPSFGALGVGGAVSLVLGSVMVTDVVPGVRVGLGVIVPAAVGFAVIFLFLGRLALRAQMRPPVTGAQALVGQLARVRTPLLPERARPGGHARRNLARDQPCSPAARPPGARLARRRAHADRGADGSHRTERS